MLYSEITRFQMLCETPQQIGDFEWDLTNAESNLKLKDYLTGSYGVKSLPDFNGLKMYRKDGNIFAIDNTRTEFPLVFWVKTDVKPLSAVNKNVLTQRALWRDGTSNNTDGLAKHIFFNIWLPEFHFICTDSKQTASGQRFWSSRIKDAFDLGLKVFYVQEVTPRYFVRVESNADFNQLVNSKLAWGTDDKFKNRKFIITDQEITAKPQYNTSFTDLLSKV